MVIGISTDKVGDQQKFTDKEGLTFPLLADAEQKVTKAFGVMMANRKLSQRVTFVIDKKGVIRKIYKVSKAGDHPEEVLKYVKSEFKEEKK